MATETRTLHSIAALYEETIRGWQSLPWSIGLFHPGIPELKWLLLRSIKQYINS